MLQPQVDAFRREFLLRAGSGLGSVALAAMLHGERSVRAESGGSLRSTPATPGTFPQSVTAPGLTYGLTAPIFWAMMLARPWGFGFLPSYLKKE